MTGKKLIAACLAASFLTVMLSGCLVTKAKFNAQTDELKVTQDALTKVQVDRDKNAADLAAAKQAAVKLQTDLAAAKTACKKAQDACTLAERKVKTLQTESIALKKQADEASTARASAKKSSDACKAAETQVKLLKGEVADLNKQIDDLKAQVKTLSEKPAKTSIETLRE